MENDNRSSAISTLLVFSCTLISRILGFVRTASIGAFYGTGGAADAINLVFNIPNNLRKLLAEGALSTAFIPELGRQNQLNVPGANNLVRSIIGFQIIALLPFIILCMFFPSHILNIFEQFRSPEKKEISIYIFRWTIPYLLLVSISAIMMAVHNTHGKFFIPAIAPTIFSLSVIVAIIFSGEIRDINFFGIGVISGGILQILIQLPTFMKMGYSLKPIWCFRTRPFRAVIKNWLPMAITSSLFVINNQIAMLISSILPDGHTSFITYAIVFFQLPFGLFSASITTVLYPKMTRLAVRGEIEALFESLRFGIRNLWALLLPASLFMIFLGQPVVSIAFERMAFSTQDTVATAKVLSAYCLGMAMLGQFNILQRAMYAIGAIRQACYIALITVLIDIVISLVLVFYYEGNSVALALANSIAFSTGAIIQYFTMKRFFMFSLDRHTNITFLKTIFATATGVAVILFSEFILGENWWLYSTRLFAIMKLAIIGIISSAIVLFLYALMRFEIFSLTGRRNGKQAAS